MCPFLHRQSISARGSFKKNRRVLMSSTVVAFEDVPIGTMSEDYPVHKFCASPSFCPSKVHLRLDDKSRLVHNEGKWYAQCLKISDDVHGCSLLLERGSKLSASVRIRTVKSVKSGEEFKLWFSQDLLAAMDIPFLNPVNIQGEKTYKCHRCGKTFEYPNPLKLHLALNCAQLKMEELWKRLRESLKINAREVIRPHEFVVRLSLKESPKNDPQRDPPSPTFTSYSSPSPERQSVSQCPMPCDPARSSSEPPPRQSAFKPYHDMPKHPVIGIDEDSRIPTAIDHFPSALNAPYDLNHQAAEIETLVSNLGQSKQGHLCLYCGKIYSRKYGLKIHIRTHTGFKPLKCKYCLRPFGDPSNLNKHVRLHADSDTPYRCDLCGKMLVRRRDLERHLKTRHALTEVKVTSS